MRNKSYFTGRGGEVFLGAIYIAGAALIASFIAALLEYSDIMAFFVGLFVVALSAMFIVLANHALRFIIDLTLYFLTKCGAILDTEEGDKNA